MGSHVGASTAPSEKDRSDESRGNAGLKTHMFLAFLTPVSDGRTNDGFSPIGVFWAEVFQSVWVIDGGPDCGTDKSTFRPHIESAAQPS